MEVSPAAYDSLSPLPENFSRAEKEGKFYLQYQGWMLEGERDSLIDSYGGPPDGQEAIQLLYEASQRTMVHGRDIRIRCRRGAAAPSDMLAFSFTQKPVA